MFYESTENAQNTLGRMIKEMKLSSIDGATPATKKQFFKASNAMNKAWQELDILNDMIEAKKNKARVDNVFPKR